MRSTRVFRNLAVAAAVAVLIASCGSDDPAADDASEPSVVTTVDTVEAEATTPTAPPSTDGPATGDVCDDREALRSSIEALADVDLVAGGTDGITTAVDAVRSDLAALRSSAGAALEQEVQAVEDALAAVEAGLADLGDGGGPELLAAFEDLGTAAQDLLTSLDDQACG